MNRTDARRKGVSRAQRSTSVMRCRPGTARSLTLARALDKSARRAQLTLVFLNAHSFA